MSSLAVLSLLVGSGCTPRNNANEELRRKLRDGDVRRIVILAIPRDITLQKGASTETIEEMSFVKLELRAAAVRPEVQGLDRALADTGCKPLTRPDEVRTAILFYDINNVKITAFYYGFDETGLGQIDQTPCQLGPGLLKWTHRLLPSDVLP